MCFTGESQGQSPVREPSEGSCRGALCCLATHIFPRTPSHCSRELIIYLPTVMSMRAVILKPVFSWPSSQVLKCIFILCEPNHRSPWCQRSQRFTKQKHKPLSGRTQGHALWCILKVGITCIIAGMDSKLQFKTNQEDTRHGL